MLIKTKNAKKENWSCFQTQDVVFIVAINIKLPTIINVKRPTIVGILTCMRMMNFILS